ncbi:hypothetical protein NHQ30_000914 [Ciborinia camelliae]|nr:hypothetical protein NHQ30_000914 [Ciborinia camelliae]
MSQPIHTLGQGCDLAPPSSSEQVCKPCDSIPPLKAWFFYCSPLPLDDSLTAVQPPTADSKNIKHPPRPFSKCDNKALLEAWMGMSSKRDRRTHNRTSRPKLGVEPATDKKFGGIGLRSKKQEAFKESFKPTIENPETYQPTTGSTTYQQPTESESTNRQKQPIAGGKEENSALRMIGCPCKGTHLWCRKKKGTCQCTSCPKAPQDVVAKTQTYQPQISPEQTKGKQPCAEPINESESRNDLQIDRPDQIKHSKHWEHDCRRGRSEREISGKESKLGEDTEPGCLCNQPLEDSDRKMGRSEEPKALYPRPTEPLPTEPLKSSKQRKEKSEERKPDNLQPECLSGEEGLQQDSTDQINRSKHWNHNCRRGRSERERSQNEPAGNTFIEPAKETKPATTKPAIMKPAMMKPATTKLATMKLKNKGKAVPVAEEEEVQTEETKAWPATMKLASKKLKNKGKAVPVAEEEEEVQTEETKAWPAKMKPAKTKLKNNEKTVPVAEQDEEAQMDETKAWPATAKPAKTKPAKTKLKNKGKTVPVAEQDGAAQIEETEAWFDQQLKAQMEPISDSRTAGKPTTASFYRDQRQKTDDTKDSGDSDGSEDEEDACCAAFNARKEKDDLDSPASRMPSCCDDSKGNIFVKRQQSEAETIFSGTCNKIKVIDNSSSRVQSEDSSSDREQSEAETIFSGVCDESKVDKRTESEAETVFSGSCDKSKADPSKEMEASTRIPSCCDERNGNGSSKQNESECLTRLGSCCDPAKQNDKQITERPALKTSFKKVSDCCSELERSLPDIHKSVQKNNQSQHSSGSPVHKSTSYNNHVNNSETRPSAQKSHCTSENPKGKGWFFDKRQADGTTDQDDGLYDESDEDLPADHTVTDQGDAANDNCICEPQLQTSKANVLIAGNGNAYTKRAQTSGYGTTGNPFVKLPDLNRGKTRVAQYNPTNDESSNDTRKSHERDTTEDMEIEGCKAYKHKEHSKCQVEVPVGTCRLHLVTLPGLMLKPIYWSSLYDKYSCIYATWFYKDTMCPVEPSVANQLEKGYRENECWTQTWDDQLCSAIEVGPEGEEKIAHRLWPKEPESKASKYDASEHILSTDPYCAARCFYGEAAAEGKVEDSDAKPTAANSISKKYPNSEVIYKNCEEAFILKPSLCPSAYYGRRPLTKIRNGACVGIAVVRGFNWKAWYKLQTPKKLTTVMKAQSKTAKYNNTDYNKLNACPACKVQDECEKVSDLCLVIHGIGQKLSERMESFNFTYAINSFRCEMKRELMNDDVKKVLREDFSGCMVLPVNWRANLSFEDGGPQKPGDKDRTGCDYSLDDITQENIPKVRQLISDVMLDIPYYMSGHKQKMIAALTAEANRIYRLWCKNNPGFHKDGRVHVLSHSLGSAMALEVLSKQHNSVPAELSWRPNTKCFDFQTTNCFLAGSPCAFFLLLENKCLVPRKGIQKPGCECENGSTKDGFGDAGTFGCLAVDNLYNIMHCNDPIAYRLNACVDASYAACLKQAEVPDSSRSFMTAVSYAMKSAAGMSQNEEIPVGEMPRPTTIAKMPSQMEMAVHDFSAEEMAEKKFCQLNENGQVDYVLGSRQGILTNQYVDMLSAHSSYWCSRDFIRFLCVEIGRRPGKMNTLPNMRARKKSQK